MNYLIFSVFLPQILCQYAADMNMKPDVTFGDQNDRFDLTAMVDQQNRYYDRHAYADGDDSRRYSRRNAGRSKIIFSNGHVEDFSYYSPPETGTVDEYKVNMKMFTDPNNKRAQRLVKRLHEDVAAWRRSMSNIELPEKRSETVLPPDPEKEVLMHHAVPIKMTIQGFLQVPLVV